MAGTVSQRVTLLCLTALALSMGVLFWPRKPIAPILAKASALPVAAPASSDTPEPASAPAPVPSVVAATPTPEPTTPLPQGIVGVWHGRFQQPLRDLAPSVTPPRDFTPPVAVTFPVNAHERVAVILHRFDVTGPDAGVFTGEAEGRMGSTVVLSYVGNAQAGVIYLPEERRSYVIHGGDDGNVRITATDLATAPGCPPSSPVPPSTPVVEL
jgi:hypothetical protein